MCHAKDDTVLLHGNPNCKAVADIVQANTQTHDSLSFSFETTICEASFQGRTLNLRETQIPSYSVRPPWPNLSCCCWGGVAGLTSELAYISIVSILLQVIPN